MKIKTEHYNYIKKHFVALSENPHKPIQCHRESLQRQRPGKDVSQLLRWNILHTCIPSKWICDNIYSYANDDHLDTALRNIMKEMSL